MSEKLDTLVENYVTMNSQSLFKEGIDEGKKSVYVEATKKKLTQEIYDEIRAEVRDAAISEAEAIANKKAGINRINEFKKLMIQGFIVAIFVGLFVNQATDLVGYTKGSYDIAYLQPTIYWSLVFLVICIIIFGWLFISELIRLLEKGTKDEDD